VADAIDAKLAKIAEAGEYSKFIVMHGGFEVHAASYQLPEGRFAPKVMVSGSDSYGEFELAIPVPPPNSFEKAHDAATHGLGTGMRWVDESNH
jgi:hypothetical protein